MRRRLLRHVALPLDPFHSYLWCSQFLLRELSEVYELPLSSTKLQTIVDLQVVRISDQSNSYVLYLDMNAHKEAYVI